MPNSFMPVANFETSEFVLTLIRIFSHFQKTDKTIGIWEAYISHALHQRLCALPGYNPFMDQMFSRVHSAHAYENGSLMLMDYLDHGTLLVCERVTTGE